MFFEAILLIFRILTIDIMYLKAYATMQHAYFVMKIWG